MKTVAVVAYAEASSGGVNQYALSMIEALKLDDSCRYVIVTRPDNPQYDCLGLDIWRIAPPNPLRRLGNYLLLGMRLRKSWFLKVAERRLLETADLFISPAISPYPHYFLDRPFLFTFHDMQERYYPHFFSAGDRFRRFLYARGLTRAAERIITESRYVCRDIEMFWRVGEKRLVVIPAPPPTEFFGRDPCVSELRKVREKYHLPDEYLYYPAQAWPHKNHRILLDALVMLRQQYPGIQLVLTGFDHDKADSLKTMIVARSLETAVLNLGYIDYADLAAVYKLSRMLVMPSLFESISLPVYEAFSLGVPVVCSNVQALPEQVGNAGLIFDPLDAKDLAEKIGNLLGNPSLARELATRGLERIKGMNHFQYASRLRELIDSLEKQPGGQRIERGPL